MELRVKSFYTFITVIVRFKINVISVSLLGFLVCQTPILNFFLIFFWNSYYVKDKICYKLCEEKIISW